MPKAKPDRPTDKAVEDAIACIMARRAANRSQLPSVINLPDGAYLSVALLAVTALAAVAWGSNAMSVWLAALPGMLLLAGFTMKGVFGALLLYEGWVRWRRQRKEGEAE